MVDLFSEFAVVFLLHDHGFELVLHVAHLQTVFQQFLLISEQREQLFLQQFYLFERGLLVDFGDLGKVLVLGLKLVLYDGELVLVVLYLLAVQFLLFLKGVFEFNDFEVFL